MRPDGARSVPSPLRGASQGGYAQIGNHPGGTGPSVLANTKKANTGRQRPCVGLKSHTLVRIAEDIAWWRHVFWAMTLAPLLWQPTHLHRLQQLAGWRYLASLRKLTQTTRRSLQRARSKTPMRSFNVRF